MRIHEHQYAHNAQQRLSNTNTHAQTMHLIRHANILKLIKCLNTRIYKTNIVTHTNIESKHPCTPFAKQKRMQHVWHQR